MKPWKTAICKSSFFIECRTTAQHTTTRAATDTKSPRLQHGDVAAQEEWLVCVDDRLSTIQSTDHDGQQLAIPVIKLGVFFGQHSSGTRSCSQQCHAQEFL
jgi:hypothetical protein